MSSSVGSGGGGGGGGDLDTSMRSKTAQFFERCQLKPVLSETSPITKVDDVAVDGAADGATTTKYTTTSFYLDASGRSKMSLPLKFTFPSRKALKYFLKHDCIHPAPQDYQGTEHPDPDGTVASDTDVYSDDDADEEEEEKEEKDEDSKEDSVRSSLGFEVRTVRVDDEHPFEMSMKSVYSTTSQGYQQQQQSTRAIVENITVLSARTHGKSVYFDTQIIVRASQHHSDMIKTLLHVVPVLSEQPRDPPTQQSRMSYEGFPDFTLQTTLTASKVTHFRLEPFVVEVTLTDALAIDITSVAGPTPGRTLISLVMRHPNTHSEPVTITNIAMHPGHSRIELPAPPGASQNHAPTHTVCDMSKCVQWGYAPQTQPKLPMTLYPQGAFASILTVDALEHMRSRTFKSPVSVTSVVGHPSQDIVKDQAAVIDAEGNATASSSGNSGSGTRNPTTISSADAQWTTGRLAQEPSDAFRIDMQLQNKEFYVGEPFTIFLRVKNLSAEARDMMLLVAKDSDKHANAAGTTTTSSSSSSALAMAQPQTNNLNYNPNQNSNTDGDNSGQSPASQQQQSHQRATVPNTAVVSEVNGYTFGVWGLIADADNPVFRLDRDQDLLAIDAALLLGEIKGHHSVEAQLRFNPLREGTLDVPNMQLFDKRNRKWYYCTHKLNIVARPKPSADEEDDGSSESSN